MSTPEAIVAIVGSLAWPAVIITAVVMLRPKRRRP